MRIQIIGAFIKWSAKKTFGGTLNKINELNVNFRSILRTEPFMGFMLWALLTALATAIGAMVFGLALKSFIIAAGIPVASIVYLMYNIFNVAWQSFKKDRQQLFENIKNI